jgi:lytic murein transglycosylase
MRRLLLAFILGAYSAVANATCGGNFDAFVATLKQEAQTMGYHKTLVENFFFDVEKNPKVLKADQNQDIFQQDFIKFSQSLISDYRIHHAKINAIKYESIFWRIEKEFGIPNGVLLAFWAFETDFGANQGSFNTLNSLLTLAHDCRRPELFRPQIFAALTLFRQNQFDPLHTKGAWAGEIGMIQMLPADIIQNGTDGDGDGVVDLQNSVPDTLITGAKMLSTLGWQANAPWLQEILIPKNLDWNKTGLYNSMPLSAWKAMGVEARSGELFEGSTQASVLLPVGRNGPAFLTYPNFDVYLKWNQSLVYVTTAAYFASYLNGSPIYNSNTPDVGLNGYEMRALQKKLVSRGHDVGKIDGILGAKTRSAVQREQLLLRMPADAWPTPKLLNRLEF